ncbi:aspartate aminotransferase, cytoplasmic-like isoform X2 [Scaptodrosophila lebanonensis]|uniref:aspartate transaminase n=1 Tax=Drosophila lebanonensis TaxID=7225 RepID=A0A6J2UCN3_DROLE|nr:aspartate aminotransferase, cytoplasmic-like isoform X2 [Scaptodrosophila lebanonensis]
MFKFAVQVLLPKLNLIKCSSKNYSGGCDGDDKPKSAFSVIKPAPPVEIFHMIKLFQDDKDPKKVNLSVGAYRTDEGKPYVLPIIKKCEKELVNDPKLNHEYLPILGDPQYRKLAMELLLGKDNCAIIEERVLPIQTISGTGAVRVGCDFLAKCMKRRVAYCSNPTWENHFGICRTAGFKKVKGYTYWNPKKRNLAICKLLSELAEAPEGSVVILHASAHNPTGTDPSRKQWKQIAEVMKSRNLFPFFDTAYQGFASGDIDRDAWPVRYFIKEGFELLAAQSFSKNMGLYCERAGCLVLVLNDKKHIPNVASQLTLLVRQNYSNPPAHGIRLVTKVLGCEENRCEWASTVKKMSSRIKEMRKALSEKLVELETPGKWDHIVKQIGMFSFTGLKPQHAEKLINDKHIYMLKSGRINVCALTTKNVEYVAQSINEVVKADPLDDGEDCDEDGDDDDADDDCDE